MIDAYQLGSATCQDTLAISSVAKADKTSENQTKTKLKHQMN